jgi:hypothetical protein
MRSRLTYPFVILEAQDDVEPPQAWELASTILVILRFSPRTRVFVIITVVLVPYPHGLSSRTGTNHGSANMVATDLGIYIIFFSSLFSCAARDWRFAHCVLQTRAHHARGSAWRSSRTVGTLLRMTLSVSISPICISQTSLGNLASVATTLSFASPLLSETKLLSTLFSWSQPRFSLAFSLAASLAINALRLNHNNRDSGAEIGNLTSHGPVLVRLS